MEKYVTFTKADHMLLDACKSLAEGLSDFIGPGCEIVLHSLEDIEHSAVKVLNGHYSGRSEGAPITDLALEMLAKIKSSGDSHTNLVYMNATKAGEPIRSATLPIVGSKGVIIGLLCMNHYLNLPVYAFFESMLTAPGGEVRAAETFASSTGELIMQVLDEVRLTVMQDAKVSPASKNKRIIALLFEKDVFRFKDAVVKVADALCISKNTVYLHLRNLGKNGKEHDEDAAAG